MRSTLRSAVLSVLLAVGAAWSIARGGADGDATNSADFAGLGAADPDTREETLQDLASATSPDLSELQAALESEPSLLVKAGIAEVIVRRKPSEAEVTELTKSLRASDLPTRLEAARLLGRTRPKTARDALQRVAENRTESPEVRAVAAVSLGRAGEDTIAALSALVAATDTMPALRAAAFRGLALAGADGVEAVAGIAQAAATPDEQRDAAFTALSETDAASGDALVALMGSKSDAVRERAISATIARGAKSSAVADALAERLTDWSPRIRHAAVGALVALDGASSKKSDLLELLKDENEGVLVATIAGLGRAFAGGDTTVADALAELLSHDRFPIRYHAALALGALKDTRGLDAMTNHAPSETEEERAAADDAAAQIAANAN